jgi:hypothetical protein
MKFTANTSEGPCKFVLQEQLMHTLLALGNVKQLDFVCEFGEEGFEKWKEQAEGIERTWGGEEFGGFIFLHNTKTF